MRATTEMMTESNLRERSEMLPSESPSPTEAKTTFHIGRA